MDLKALKNLTNQAIETANLQRSLFNEAINWGSLECVTARRVEEESGVVYYEVIIEEACVYAPSFQKFVEDFLANKGIEDVHVRTEW